MVSWLLCGSVVGGSRSLVTIVPDLNMKNLRTSLKYEKSCIVVKAASGAGSLVLGKSTTFSE